MRRRARVILRIALPLLLGCVLAAWGRSYLRWDMLTWTDSNRFIYVLSSGGRMSLISQDWLNGTASPAGWSVESGPTRSGWDEGRAHDGFRFAGFEWSDEAWWSANDSNLFASYYIPPHRIVAVPYWFLAAVLALPLGRAWVIARRRRSRLARRLCPDCGYDLRASQGRCPECGASNAAPAMPAAQPMIR